MEQDLFSTAAEQAYKIICEQILAGSLKPGEKLSRRKMAELTGVSIIPVIEALHKLENEGLVESKPHWGSRVILLTDRVIKDRYALREAVECQVVRMLCGNLHNNQALELQKMAEKLDILQQKNEMDEFWEIHYSFHLRMSEMTGYESFVDALHRINLFLLLQRAEIEARQNLSTTTIPEDNHMRIVRALEKNDPYKAEEVMRTHIYQSGLVTRKQTYNIQE